MAVLFSAYEIEKSFGSQLLFRDLTFGLESGQKIGLIGPNGAGKSTLLKIISRLESADGGKLSFANNLRLGYLAQTPKFKEGDTVYNAILDATEDPYDYENMNLTSELISKLELDGPKAGTDRLLSELSGGWQKRVALARELAKRPNLLLLDEPTNHLDITSIRWLEEELASRHDLAVLMVTHDRLFLQNVCDRIYDLDRRNPDGLLQFEGTYADFLDYKNSVIEAQKNLESVRRNTLRRETEWLRRGAKARQTKQKARIERHADIADEVDALAAKNRERNISLDFGDIGRSPKKVIEAKDLGIYQDDRWLVHHLNFILGPRSRIGLVGDNGCGKSTLIRTLLGEQAPQEGSVYRADGLTYAVFEQNKKNLNPALSLLKTLCPEGDYVHVQGKPVYAKSYLARFHFRTDQMDLPVGKLSGGEQTRLLLARLMLQTEPVLILDEPTNDLDIETLNTLEESLSNFPGAVILVSHDRYFMGQVCNDILAFSQSGQIERFADMFQWDKWQIEESKKNSAKGKGGKNLPADNGSGKSKAKLGYKEQREYDTMEETIQKAEAELAKIQKDLDDPTQSSNFNKLQELSATFQKQQSAIEKLYARWEELTKKVGE